MNEVLEMIADRTPSTDIAFLHRLLLVAPSPPPYGGMALQARLLEKRLRNDGHSVVFLESNLSLPAWLRPLDHIRGVRAFARALIFLVRLWRQMGSAEIVHVLAASWLYFFLVVYPAVILGRLRGKRVILNYRGGEARQFFRWWAWLVKPAFRFADAISTPSEFLGELIRKQFHMPVVIVPNISDGAVFKYRQRTTFQPKMLVTRHLEKIYDVETVIKAFRSVQEHHQDASLWIAGTGSQSEHLRALVSTWQLKNVTFLGHIPHPDLPRIYDQCDIFINASRVDNFPAALLEASAAGLVVISTCAGGIPFIYQDGKNALLVEPGDWEGLARGVERVLDGASLGHDLASQAAALARGYDWTEVRKALYKAYGFTHEQPEGDVAGISASRELK